MAAGRGERLGGAPKQYREIAGVPMLLRAIRPFATHPEVAHIVAVLPTADAAMPPDWLASLLGARLSVVAGGAERRASVTAGIGALPPACTTVLVHDAARPLVSGTTVDAVLAAALAGDGAIAAVPITDTVKEATAAGAVVARTVPRERLWRAQTPQGFPRALLERAHDAATADASATDDAELVERIGGTVRLIPDSVRNLKVTSADDLLLAELFATHPA